MLFELSVSFEFHLHHVFHVSHHLLLLVIVLVIEAHFLLLGSHSFHGFLHVFTVSVSHLSHLLVEKISLVLGHFDVVSFFLESEFFLTSVIHLLVEHISHVGHLFLGSCFLIVSQSIPFFLCSAILVHLI